ncbi:MAG TPA: DUF192 domain-containing protein [bacterium]|nr:DUF192 domain-containing protein [bacterium]
MKFARIASILIVLSVVLYTLRTDQIVSIHDLSNKITKRMKRESPKYDKKMVVNNIEMSVALAISKEEQTQGLMEISTLPDNAGMLFIFDQEGGWGFWMKNTLIPLDMIWINKSFEIVDIQTAPPCPPEEKDCPAYRPTVPAKYVLEVNGGWAKRNNVTVGNKVNIDRILSDVSL